MTTATLPSLSELRAVGHAVKCSPEWRDQLWAHWPTEAHWPGVLDVYEAAAFVRVHPDTIRRACAAGRDKRAVLGHQRLGVSIRIKKSALAGFGAVEARG